ncbi:hypothetical protein SAY87_022042 [Trapa incisa]|uniref:S-locus receptor kinase C-terminal domain-containing protein n=1 Tax=Trapa incisa TaxID=236973 RepID=A0AAN7PSW2_9MYRT|nr:hypothetical protein SAY87_022042 [Trapa incisa]
MCVIGRRRSKKPGNPRPGQYSTSRGNHVSPWTCRRFWMGLAWELWKEGKGVNLLDEAIISADSINSTTQEVMKCMQIGLLCIQDHAVDRPNMPTVVMMLSGETDLPHPKAPSFTDFHVTWDQEYYSQQGSNPSINMVTCSVTQGR